MIRSLKGNKDEINFIDSDEGNGYAEIIKDFTQIIKMNGFYFVNLLWQYIPIQNKN